MNRALATMSAVSLELDRGGEEEAGMREQSSSLVAKERPERRIAAAHLVVLSGEASKRWALSL
jgi:hypothetical protein